MVNTGKSTSTICWKAKAKQPQLFTDLDDTEESTDHERTHFCFIFLISIKVLLLMACCTIFRLTRLNPSKPNYEFSYLISMTGRQFVLSRRQLIICDVMFFVCFIFGLTVLYTKIRDNGCISVRTINVLNVLSAMCLITANLIALMNMRGKKFSSKWVIPTPNSSDIKFYPVIFYFYYSPLSEAWWQCFT